MSKRGRAGELVAIVLKKGVKEVYYKKKGSNLRLMEMGSEYC